MTQLHACAYMFELNLQVTGSLVHLHGRLDLMNHKTRGTPDGAISVTSFGQFLVHRGVHINFINNTGV